MANARLLIKRTREFLEQENAPLRLHFDKETAKIRLIDCLSTGERLLM